MNQRLYDDDPQMGKAEKKSPNGIIFSKQNKCCGGVNPVDESFRDLVNMLYLFCMKYFDSGKRDQTTFIQLPWSKLVRNWEFSSHRMRKTVAFKPFANFKCILDDLKKHLQKGLY